MDNSKVVAQALSEYGQAMRNDWSEIDGGGVEFDMGILSQTLLQKHTAGIEGLRRDLCLKQDGSGVWEWKH
jgi:hypothetical protein